MCIFEMFFQFHRYDIKLNRSIGRGGTVLRQTVGRFLKIVSNGISMLQQGHTMLPLHLVERRSSFTSGQFKV